MNYINNLPDELVNKIYSYLDVESIKKFSLTCKRSSNVLASSSYLLNKYFKLKLHGDFWTDKEKIYQVLYLKRYLCEIDIANSAGSHNILTAIFKKYGFQVVTLRISSTNIDDFTFREILKLCPMLKDLYLSEVKIVKKLPAINPPCMTALQSLTVVYCDWEIFKFFTRTQVTLVSVKSYLDEGNRKDLLRFLTHQKKLKVLTVHGTSLRLLFQSNDINENCSFNLETLKIDNAIGKNSEICNLNIITFINKMDESLRNVEICGPHNEDITIFAILHLDNLKSLTIDARNLPKSQQFYQQLAEEPKNSSLNELKLVGFLFQQNSVKTILLKYPMIENLEIFDWANGPTSDLLDFISKNLSRLRHLKITEITNNEHIKLDALQNFSVQYISNGRKLVNFMARNNSVDTLNIGLVYIGQVPDFMSDLKDLSNVKHLSVGGNKTALRKMLAMIRTGPPQKLETLKLALVNEEKNATQKIIKFNLPFDPNDLNVKFNVLI